MSCDFSRTLTGPFCYALFIAHLHKKNKGGRTYYYIRESTSIGGKTVITNQVYLGTLEKIMEMATPRTEAGMERIQAQEFGALQTMGVLSLTS